MSTSRAAGVEETSCARRSSSSVVSPIAERTATTRFPASRAATRRCATALIRAVSATEVPPNFMTTVPDGPDASPATAGIPSYCVVAIRLPADPRARGPG